MTEIDAYLRASLARLEVMERQIADIGAIVYAGPRWLVRNYTEPQVLYALRDLIRPGQTAFDVGANFGDLSIAMSRRAGPRGVVCAFEANPEIARLCQAALLRSGCSNTQVYNTAIYHTSRQKITLYLSDNMVSDSIHRHMSDRSIEVSSLALDDFVEETGLVPEFVKMDIEGAEPDALEGFAATIERHKPILVLEQAPDDDRCLVLLRDQGYRALELRSYRSVETLADIPEGTIVTDILYSPPDRLEGTPYNAPVERVVEAELGKDGFHWTSEQTYEAIQPVNLSVGRYLVTVEFTSRVEAEMKCGVSVHSVPIMQYHGGAAWLSRAARQWVVAVDEAGPASLFFNFVHEPDPELRVTGACIMRLPAFDNHAPLLT